jgi:arginyl-tRNA synthetase
VTPAGLADIVLSTARSVLAARGLDPSVVPATTGLRPHDGAYASTLALQVAGRVGLAPRDLAAALAECLSGAPGICAVEVAGPGYLNIRIEPAVSATEIVKAGRGYGRSPAADAAVRSALPGGTGELRFARIHTPGEPDVERWTRHHADNPAYRVRYAHAKAARQATAEENPALLTLLGEFPAVVEEAASRREPSLVAHYLDRVAVAYERSAAHSEATRVVLANGLDLLGVDAPERM